MGGVKLFGSVRNIVRHLFVATSRSAVVKPDGDTKLDAAMKPDGISRLVAASSPDAVGSAAKPER